MITIHNTAGTTERPIALSFARAGDTTLPTEQGLVLRAHPKKIAHATVYLLFSKSS